MRKTCAQAHDQLQKWNGIRSEWDDHKTDEVESEYIDPMQILLTRIDEKLCEIGCFISETEENLHEIKEETGYGECGSS